jgi:CHAD domain-containing protein
MAFSLAAKSNLRESLALVAAREIDGLARTPAGDGSHPDPRRVAERVHETRKSIKRLRALLRLFRSAISPSIYAREDARLRQLGRSLGGARDATALRESLDCLVESASANARSRLLDAMPVLLGALGGEQREHQDAILATLGSVHDALGAFAERAASFRVRRSDWSVIAPGFRRTYGRGRRAMRRALRRVDPKRLHDLRIAVKRHQYQLNLLEPMWPGPIDALRREVQRLGDVLGHHHDLSLLEQRFDALSERPDVRAVDSAFHEAAETYRAELEREAFELAARVYAESPERITERFREYFEAWT